MHAHAQYARFLLDRHTGSSSHMGSPRHMGSPSHTGSLSHTGSPSHVGSRSHAGSPSRRKPMMQVVGFFIVEERVQASFGEEGGEGWQGSSGWEAAQASLKSQLEAACAAFQDPAPLRSLKDFTLLSCTALGVLQPSSSLSCPALHCLARPFIVLPSPATLLF